ncbi:ATP-binding protein [Parapedobacter defluvii]|uniref:ATP-binding protein n=1 Tax=Parapedobacter defluvii TaxID=2045106 RepID=A0ABQ1LIT2_9SPHI|nr:AAA family ATPase [Parapedobacter defluvii]GGC25208.1 ATP-binding protein [Parapedobacter defluvii]
MDIQLNEKAMIITGGPGMGKTSLIERLGQIGYPCVQESGRHIIQAELKSGGNNLPWADRQGFAKEMFNRAVADYGQALHNNTHTFFDRGLPDVIGYLMLCNLPISDTLWTAAKTYRYHPRVFIAPPWSEIYTVDNERKQSFEEAKATYEAMANVYMLLGYSLIEIPKVSLEERVQFIIKNTTKKLLLR